MGLETGGLEEATSSAGVANADAFADDAKAFAGYVFIAAKNYDSAGAHVLFFDDNGGNTLVAKIGKGFGGVFEQARLVAGLCGRHCGRQIDEPLWIYGKAAHHLERGHGVLLGNGDVGV